MPVKVVHTRAYTHTDNTEYLFFIINPMQKDGTFLHLSLSYTFLPSFLGSSLSMLPALLHQQGNYETGGGACCLIFALSLN